MRSIYTHKQVKKVGGRGIASLSFIRLISAGCSQRTIAITPARQGLFQMTGYTSHSNHHIFLLLWYHLGISEFLTLHNSLGKATSPFPLKTGLSHTGLC